MAPRMMLWPGASCSGTTRPSGSIQTMRGTIRRSIQQRLAIQRPALAGLRAEFAVEIDRTLVPVEHRPFEASTADVTRDLLERAQQIQTNAAAAKFGAHEQILEVQARAA